MHATTRKCKFWEEDTPVHCDICGKECNADTAITDDFLNYCGDACYRKAEEKPAPDLSHWLTVSIQEEEESRENHTVRFWREFADLLTEQPAARRFYEQEG